MKSFTLAISLFIFTSFGSYAGESLNTLSEKEKNEGWKLLFNGTDKDGWRTYQKEVASELWQVIDGALVLTAKGGGDLIYKKTFSDFELKVEWQITKDGNSGIFWRASEDAKKIYMTSPEYQVVDHFGEKFGNVPVKEKAGSEFGLYDTDPKLAKPPGQWNQSRILVKGNDVKYYLNGTKTVEYTLYSEEWEEKIKNTKFSKWPKYARNAKGFIGLQDHGDKVLYRNIKIREL
ncbi:MAG: DUF1080 domain-containing protein [Verrucomicrobiota bacterium]